jgi:hypothetical protein
MMTGCAGANGLLDGANTFALVRLVPAGDRDKDAEILVLRRMRLLNARTRRCAGTS